MTRSTSQPSPVPDQNPNQYQHWEFPESAAQVYLHSGMAQRFEAQILAGSEGGRETGGILLGRVETHGDKTKTFIEDFVPVPCSYTSGPLYVLSDEDTTAFEAALLRAAQAACDSHVPPVLGYYRAHHRDGWSFGDEDLTLIEGYFPQASNIFVLVKAAPASQACMARFSVWKDEMQTEFSSIEVALTPPPLKPPPPAAITDPLPPPTVPAPEPPPEVLRLRTAIQAADDEDEEPEPEVRSAWPSLLLKALVILLAAAAVVVLVIRYLETSRQTHQNAAAAPAASGPLGFHVDPRPADLLLSWNLKAPDVINAQRGILYIRDGNDEKKVDFDKDRLNKGTFAYTPAAKDLDFLLQVYDAAGQTAVESAHVVWPPGS